MTFSVGCVRHEIAPTLHHLSGVGRAIDRRDEHHRRADGVNLELERGDHAEVAAAAADAPEKLGIFILAGGAQHTVGGDDIDRDDVVEAQAELAAQPTDTAGQRQPGDAGRRNQATGGRQAVYLGLAIEIAPGRAALDPGAPRLGIDVHGVHVRQIDQDAAVARTAARRVVAATAHRGEQPFLTCEVDRGNDVGGAVATCDKRRLLVEHAVPNEPDSVVAVTVR
jgi:hypothetical protein